MIDIKVPTVGESINEVTLVKWLKNDGDYVERDEVVAELESEKATFEVNAEQAGILKTVSKEGDTLHIGDTVAQIDESAAKPEKSEVKSQKSEDKKSEPVKSKEKKVEKEKSVTNNQPTVSAEAIADKPAADLKATPVAAAMIADKKVDAKNIQASGYNGKILKEDVIEALSHPGRKPGLELFSRGEKTEKMSSLRKTVSRRLVEAK